MSPPSASDAPFDPFTFASLRGCEIGRIRRLKGFLKGAHFEPDRHSPAADSFVSRAGASDVQERAEALFADIRTAFGLKRKEIIYQCEAGSSVLQTPAFDVSLEIAHDPSDPRNFRISCTVNHFRQSHILLGDPFIEVFRTRCDSLVVEFPQAPDLEALIDAIEDNSRLAKFLEYPADASWLAIQLPEPSVRMEMRSDCATFRLPPGGDLRELVAGATRLLSDLRAPGSSLPIGLNTDP